MKGRGGTLGGTLGPPRQGLPLSTLSTPPSELNVYEGLRRIRDRSGLEDPPA